MNDREEKQYAMTTVLVQFIDKHHELIGASAVAAAEAADIAPAYQLLTAAVGTAPLTTVAGTQQATELRAELLRIMPALLGPLRSIATKTNDTDLLARATLSSRQLYKMKPEELRDVTSALFKSAADHAGALAPYGLPAPVVAQLLGKQTAFAGTVRGTSSLIDQRSQHNDTAVDRLNDLLQQVYELDKPMEVFRVLNPALHRAYKKARRVGSTGGGSAPDKPGL